MGGLAFASLQVRATVSTLLPLWHQWGLGYALSTNMKLSWLRGAGPGEEERDVLRQWHGTLKQLWEDAQKV